MDYHFVVIIGNSDRSTCTIKYSKVYKEAKEFLKDKKDEGWGGVLAKILEDTRYEVCY